MKPINYFIYFYLFIYLAGFTMFYNIFLRPINLLSFFSTVLCHSNLLLPTLLPFSRMLLKTPSIHVILGLPVLPLLPGGTHSNTLLGNLSSVILFTWPYHFI